MSLGNAKTKASRRSQSGVYHALNQGNARNAIFEKREDYDAIDD